jgi:uncharacterized protein YqeY
VGLLEKIDEQMLDAAKTKDKLRLSTIRMIKAAIQNRGIEKREKLEEEEVIQTISSLIKKARESIEQFKKGQRADLVEKEEAELKILLSFMPKQMEGDEIEKVVDKTIQELQAKDMKDFGTVMKTVMAQLKGKADGRMVNEILKGRLSGQ